MSDKHLVCKGATVYCSKSMVNNSPGTAIPLTITSNTLVELNGGKVAATDKDCTPANMCFGNCNTGTNPPPPCVANVQWSKYYEDAEVTKAGLKFLTEESEATCMAFGGKVKIAFHGQVANPQPEEQDEVSPEVMVGILPVNPTLENNESIKEDSTEDKEKQVNIVDAYWVDDKKARHREFPIDTPVLCCVKVENPVAGKMVRLQFKDLENKGYEIQNYSGTIDAEGIIEIKEFRITLKK